MKREFLIILLVVALAPRSFSNDCVDCKTSQVIQTPMPDKAIKSFENILKAGLDEKTATEYVDVVSAFLNKIKETTDFDSALARQHIQHLRLIMAKTDLSLRLRARAQLLCSGVIGKLAEKNKSGELGKESYHMAKNVMKVDPNYKEAKTAFIATVTKFSERNIIIRKAIESAVDISIPAEAKEAIAIIEREKWQNNDDMKVHYKKLKKFLD